MTHCLQSGWQRTGILKSGVSVINIHNMEYLKGIDSKIHLKITKEWTSWGRAIGHNPAAQEIIDFAEIVNEKYKKY